MACSSTPSRSGGSLSASVFASLGIELTESDLLGSTGQTIAELIPVWRQRPAGPDASTELSDDDIADRITDQVIAYVVAEGGPMPGVTEAIELFRKLRASASRSPRRRRSGSSTPSASGSD